MHQFRLAAILVVAFAAAGAVDTSGPNSSPSDLVEVVVSSKQLARSEDPAMPEIRRFLRERGTTVEAAAVLLREQLRLPEPEHLADAGGCHGPTPSAEARRTIGVGSGGVTQAMLDAIVADVVARGPAALAGQLIALEEAGGAISLDTAGRLDDATIALAVGNELFVSADWVYAARSDASSIHANLAHEVLGHMRYQTPISCVLLETALADTAAIADFDDYRAAYLTFVYPETEIYAELQELEYHSELALGDDPYLDIIVQVRKIEAVFPPKLAELIFEWLRHKCATDPTLSTDAVFYCHAALDRNPE